MKGLGWVSWYLHLGDLVESAEELVEHSDQLFGCAGARQLREAHDVGVQDATWTHTDKHTTLL